MFDLVDGASLGFVRIGFGLIVAWEGVRYLDRGWVDRYYGGPKPTFTYRWFEFVQPLPDPFTPLPWLLMIGAGIWLATGRSHRGAATLCWLTLSYSLLLDKSQYLNHMYLMALLAFLLAVVPAGNALALGRRLDRPVPAIAVDLIAFQIAVPYFFGGVAKLNGEWFAGRPLVGWLAESTDVPVFGPLFGFEAIGHGLALAAVLFDLTIVGFLIWRRTRPAAFLFVVLFHVLNARLFSIGVFPWLMILATTIYLPTNWPRLAVGGLRGPDVARRARVVAAATIGAVIGAFFFPTVVITHVVVSAFGFGLVAWLYTENRAQSEQAEPAPAIPWKGAPIGPWRTAVVIVAAVWVAVQVTVPLRHHLSSTEVAWAEDGHRFSWRMKLREKHGTLQLTIEEPDGSRRAVALDQHLRQRQISKMTTRPDMIVDFARRLEDQAGYDIGVFAESAVSLNGRSLQPFVRPDVDLTEVESPWLGAAWYITPRAE
ncbi:MAG: HTTM domain-containing protein [Actinomycetota bacterium]